MAIAALAVSCASPAPEDTGASAHERPSRIVSLSPTATEMLFAIDAGEQVTAVDEYSNYPPDAPTTELSGFNPNFEAIAGYEPDLVVLSAFSSTIVPQLDSLGIPSLVIPDDPASLDDVYSQIRYLGEATGRTTEAADLVARMNDDIEKIVADVPERDTPLSYYIEIDDSLWAYTSSSIVGSLFGMVGLRNIAQNDDLVSMQLSAEAIIGANPDVIFLTNSAYGVSADTVAGRPGWGEIAAVMNGDIVELDTDIASRWGPRIVDLLDHVVDAVNHLR